MLLPVVHVLAFVATVQGAVAKPRDVVGDLQHQAIAALKGVKTHGPQTCKLSKAAVRKDWASMSGKERKAYTTAVQCLLASPSKSDPALVPGARNRYDDFVGQHINQTLTIHGTGNFLTWHRMFVYAYEKALREECDYAGYQPYWNWFSHQSNLKASPVFDGSATSMSGDGSFVAHNGSVGGGGTIFLPSGEGGGCLLGGPFKGMTANLGPVSPTMRGQERVNGSLSYNPRCLKRDLTTYASSNWLTDANLLNITTGAASKSLSLFQNELQGRFSDGFLGLHAAGHFSIGGDAGDIFSSPVDPVFFLHHAMVDRVYWIWQALHLDQAKTVAGTITLNNNPPSRDATLEDLIELNYLDMEPTTIGDLTDTLGNGLCYVYQ
ncbi:Di-copper centre-containing protein [Didymella exigua CBS 183.55]|uniref:Di-copper centre-containing protein n=1 Tax=Didymella exigua CBS 183.55 TaxID=1150837 RepID=A0A6A5S296_9PLEO|nr:Di-copper centre-containing protein [Didymella exigua CBS 183.55]KAF1934232.1 Di-copper centre-containing protein [Didymella exigua CBS 183.55]